MNIIGHRGVRNIGENTIESICNIKNYNHNLFNFGIEIDVQLLSDDQFICYHDKDYNGKPITEYKYTDINKNIPKLEDILRNFIFTRSYLLNIEVKLYDEISDNKNICTKLLNLINKYKMEDCCLISSFDNTVIDYFIENTNIKTSLIFYDTFDYEKINKYYNKGVKYLVIDKQLVNKFIEKFAFTDINLFIFTFFCCETCYDDDKKLIKKLKYRDNIYFITDNINNVMEALKE